MAAGRLDIRGSQNLFSRLVALGLILSATPAFAYTNIINIRVSRDRLWQCGTGWDPQRTGKWSNPTGRIFLNRQLVREFDLRNQGDCEKVTTVSVDAGKDQEIVVTLENEHGSHVYRRYTVAADRVWEFYFFSDSHGLVDVSTDWEGAKSRTLDPSGNTSGYELYFNGKRVSGPDARHYTRRQAQDNCDWNARTKPNIVVNCFFNGAKFR